MRRTGLSAVLWCGLGLGAGAAGAFEYHRHFYITQSELARLQVPATTREHLVEFEFSRHHFDNMKIQHARDYVRGWIDFARRYLLEIDLTDSNELSEDEARKFEEAMANFGFAVHAVQDFYAHSTWIECLDRHLPAGQDSAPLPLW